MARSIRFAIVVATATCLIHSAQAAVLLPDSFVVVMGGGDGIDVEQRIVLIDPGRRPPEVISSSSVGEGPVFSRPIVDMELGPDRNLYLSDRDRVIYRVDPSTGRREIVSDRETGSGPRLDSLAGEFAIDSAGTLFFAHGRRILDDVYLVITSLDPATGQREILLDQLIGFPFSSWGRGTIDLIDDARLAVSMGSSQLGPNRVFIVNLAAGTIDRSTGFHFDPVSSLLASPGNDVVYLRMESPTRIEELDLNRVGRPRPLLSCADSSVPLEAEPWRFGIDDRDRLVFGANVPAGFCTSSGQDPRAPRPARLYRLDPRSGEVELLFESEPTLRATFIGNVVPISSDFPFDDQDSDAVPDAVDVCPEDFDPDQADLDGDGIGDVCNQSIDGDGDEIADGLDVCPETADPSQGDLDGDTIGDACDPFPLDDNHRAAEAEAMLLEVQADLRTCQETLFTDTDEDGVSDLFDRCPMTRWMEAVDEEGCSLAQFCHRHSPRRAGGAAECFKADWRDDDEGKRGDCRIKRRKCVPR